MLWVSGRLRIRGWWRRGVAVLGVVAFVLLCRAEPSVLRAAAMGLVGLAALGWLSLIHIYPALLVADSVTCVVQVQGKVRAKLSVVPTVTEDELATAALADPGVQRALAGRGVRQVIVRAPRLVSIVPS